MALVWHEKASRTALQTSSVLHTHVLKNYINVLNVSFMSVFFKSSLILQSNIIGSKSKAVIRIRIRWIRKILASWIRIRKNADPDSRGKISTKNCKKLFYS